ncbi:MAG: hypothetical protein BGP00_06090 [Novosphingobium sp. 63-713]|uniref:hypothetical protein n=1 Tax=unclassified Novosphingobium TaxID=2644732 RepID=UPI00095C70C5|nr:MULTISPECIES: hypothetical protein [unclassified Novosphingobium]MBN9142494.1 hypothetical protein [Novosphingobium sp.]OJX93793.1 MAG: hypothetical protein BGP00_06090 [Novosphingobium sp. 63-713]
MTRGYLAYRCPHCGSDRCGNDANAGWDVVTQQSILLGEFDNQWCNDCGDVPLEEYTITDPVEIARIDAARADLTAKEAGPLLLAAADRLLVAVGDFPVSRGNGQLNQAIAQLLAAIAAARPTSQVEGTIP